MKKVNFLTILCLSLILGITSCSKENDNAIQPTGKANLSIENNSQIVIASSRTKATTSIPDSYTVKVTNGADVVAKEGTYGSLKTGIVLPAATGYKIYAENITEATALSNNGSQRIAGQSIFDIIAGETTNVAFTCTMVNTQVSVAYTDTFKAMFTDYSVTISESSNPTRSIVYNTEATIAAPLAYFSAPAKPATTTITAQLTAKRIIDGVERTMNKTIEIKAAEWHKLTFNVTQTSGEAGLDITFDDTVTEVDSTHDIDPYGL